MTRPLGMKIAILTCAIAMAGCSTVSLPDLDIFDEPEFNAKEGDVLAYPEVADAPALPEGIRSAPKWDAAAKNVIKARENFNAPPAVDPIKTEQQLDDEMKSLKSRVDAYKADDPQ